MLLSYIVLVIFITIVLGSTFYFYFTSNYNEEVENVHLKMLEQVSTTLNTRIIETVESNYMILANEFISNADYLFRFHDNVSGNQAKILQTYEYLRKIVSNNSTVISNVHVFYKKQQMIISSSLGVKFLSNDNRPYYLNQDWIQEMSGTNNSYLWLETRKVPLNIGFPDNSLTADLLTYVRSYPIISTGENCDGFIAIDINENVLSNMIKSTVPSEYTNTFIINNEGKVITHSNKQLLNVELSQENYIDKILKAQNLYGSIVDEIDGVTSMVSYTCFPNENWRLINITPVSQFYARTSVITKILIILCLISIIIGIIAASVITNNLYNPMKLILDKIKALFGSSNTNNKKNKPMFFSSNLQNKENEYKIIDSAIDNLSLTIEDLQQTLQDNIPIIKYNLIIGLLHNQIINIDEAKEKFKLINIDMSFPYFAVTSMKIECRDELNLSIENKHFLTYNLINEIEKYSSNSFKCIAADLPDNCIGIIIGSINMDEAKIGSLVSNISSYAYNNFMVMVTAALGSWVDNILNIHISFRETNTLFKYKFFNPNVTLLMASSLLDRENSSTQMPGNLLDKFSKSLKLRNINKVKESVNLFRHLSQNGNYSADHCNQKMIELVHILTSYIRDMHYVFKKSEKSDIYSVFKSINDVSEFCDWIIDLVKSIFNGLDERIENQNSNLINEAKQYIYENLEKDISLDEVAEHINISSAYLSKLFKDKTGVNFVTFIKELRFERAKELLLNTSLSIQQIAFEVGYNTPAYFIQQFKAKYGYTPNRFRKQKAVVRVNQ